MQQNTDPARVVWYFWKKLLKNFFAKMHFFCSFNPRGDQYLYIDCFNKGEVLTEDECVEKFMVQYQRNDLPRNVLFEIADERKVTSVLQTLQ